MPGITLHFHLARTALTDWQASGLRPPFDAEDPVSLNAYLHGAIGPDLGYLPGGVRILSDLAHRERTGALASNLLRVARTPSERAYAWGWVTHVLADRLVHPWIGRGVGELHTGSPATFIAGADDPLSHLRVETGVDLWYAARNPAARRVRLDPVFDMASARFIQRGYAETYRETYPVDWFFHSHRSAGKRARQALASLRILGALMDDSVWRFSVPGARWLLGRAYRSEALRGVSLAYLNPIAPAPWLLRGIGQATKAYRAHFAEATRGGGQDLGDFHLDTGAPLGPTSSVGAPCSLELRGAA